MQHSPIDESRRDGRASGTEHGDAVDGSELVVSRGPHEAPLWDLADEPFITGVARA